MRKWHPLTKDEIAEAEKMYTEKHLKDLASHGINIDATDPNQGAELMEHIDAYNKENRPGIEGNPWTVREELKKYRKEQADKEAKIKAGVAERAATKSTS